VRVEDFVEKIVEDVKKRVEAQKYVEIKNQYFEYCKTLDDYDIKRFLRISKRGECSFCEYYDECKRGKTLRVLRNENELIEIAIRETIKVLSPMLFDIKFT